MSNGIAGPNPGQSAVASGTLARGREWLGSAAGAVPWSHPLLYGVLIGLIALYAFAQTHPPFGNTIALEIVVAGAAFAVGALTGFLFGIPRAQEANAPPGASGTGPQYHVNTNLEQVSDWLTKIIVGIGLTQLMSLPQKLQGLGDYVAGAFGGPPVPPPLVAAGLVYFAILGFLLFYLWTRMRLTGEFSKADREAMESPEYLEGIAQAFLYQPPPTGFTQATKNAQDYLVRFGEANYRVWRSLACAYAQQYSYLKATSQGDASALQKARDGALDAIKRAVALNPQACASLRALWDPRQATLQEDDLVAFSADPDFAAVFAACGGGR